MQNSKQKLLKSQKEKKKESKVNMGQETKAPFPFTGKRRRQVSIKGSSITDRQLMGDFEFGKTSKMQ